MRVVLTAGFDRAAHVVALAELLTRAGHHVVHVLVASPFDVRRARALVRQRGRRFLLEAARRMLGFRARTRADAVLEFLRENGIEERSLRAWCARRDVPCTTVKGLNSEPSVRIVLKSRADGVIYGGGGILRDEILRAAGGRVLNAHSGPLPAVRGMNACEWSVLLHEPLSVTIHFIDRGIDTGSTIECMPVPIHSRDTIDDLRARCTILGIAGLVRAVDGLRGPLPAASSTPAASRQCFVLAPVLRELAELDLATRAEDTWKAP